MLPPAGPRAASARRATRGARPRARARDDHHTGPRTSLAVGSLRARLRRSSPALRARVGERTRAPVAHDVGDLVAVRCQFTGVIQTPAGSRRARPRRLARLPQSAACAPGARPGPRAAGAPGARRGRELRAAAAPRAVVESEGRSLPEPRPRAAPTATLPGVRRAAARPRARSSSDLVDHERSARCARSSPSVTPPGAPRSRAGGCRDLRRAADHRRTSAPPGALERGLAPPGNTFEPPTRIMSLLRSARYRYP